MSFRLSNLARNPAVSNLDEPSTLRRQEVFDLLWIFELHLPLLEDLLDGRGSMRYCGNQTSPWIYLLVIGFIVKRWDVLSGPFIKSLTGLLVYLIVPISTFVHSLSWELSTHSLSLLFVLIPIWFLKIGFSIGISFTVSKLVTMPSYFTRTFCALLLIDSLAVPTVFYTQAHRAFQFTVSAATNASKTAYTEEEYMILSEQLQHLIRLLNSLLLFGVAPWLLKNDFLYLKTFGKSIVWINQEPYLAKFETTDMMDQQNYELLIQTRTENKVYLMNHLQHPAFIALVGALMLLLLKRLVSLPPLATSSLEFGLKGLAEVGVPAAMIVLGCMVTKLDVGFRRGLMASSKLAVIHSASKLYLIPKLLLLFSSLVSKLLPESGTLISIAAAELARASSWPPDVILLLYSVELSFAYKEVAFFIYYDWMISLLSLPLLMWQWS